MPSFLKEGKYPPGRDYESDRCVVMSVLPSVSEQNAWNEIIFRKCVDIQQLCVLNGKAAQGTSFGVGPIRLGSLTTPIETVACDQLTCHFGSFANLLTVSVNGWGPVVVPLPLGRV